MKNRTAEEIVERVTIPQALSYYGYDLGRHGRIPCPLHAGKDPNFSYNERVYHCWTCGAKGNVISLVMGLFGLKFPQAVVKMNCDFNLNLPVGKSSMRQRADAQKRRKVFREEQTEHERIRQIYLMACKLHAVLYRSLLKNPDIEGLAEYVDSLDLWLDEHCEEVRT
ncbi:CHC2 zinc finger domain-containing protein [Bacilliculturomica massiliensis]|uniref:CHC2 zinc finger domain-containing protein n=1 Tax=Bacilliculturomica massiliensis TaxID=1917867 RepID=UPI00102F4626|nr:CHC2 zinc finger domain-containing protein [Bacilliculturomica massiliensis]